VPRRGLALSPAAAPFFGATAIGEVQRPPKRLSWTTGVKPAIACRPVAAGARIVCVINQGRRRLDAAHRRSAARRLLARLIFFARERSLEPRAGFFASVVLPVAGGVGGFAAGDGEDDGSRCAGAGTGGLSNVRKRRGRPAPFAWARI
jgi:hypothetical protein